MKTDLKTKLKKIENRIIAIGYSILLCGVLAYFFDYYYELNDDYFIKNILSGVYSGTPSAHSIQMLYPLSFILSTLYRLNRKIAWFGLFLNLCQFGCIALITERILSFLTKRWTKAITLCVETIFVATFLLRELVFVQYTFTCTLLAATAAFLLYTSKPADTVKQMIKNNVISIVLAVIAFNVRSEMLLLLLPLICVTGLCKWATEKKFFTRSNVSKYFALFGVVIAGLGICYGVDVIAYSSPDWKEFRDFFDNRTELYDFQTIPAYEGNEKFYESIGMAPEEQVLLINYNFGIDDDIDAEKIGKIAQYAKEQKNSQNIDWPEKIKDIIKDYVYRTFHGIDIPWNLMTVTMYVLVFFCALCNRHFRFIWELVLMGLVRTGLWGFLLYRGRTPERITYSLYLTEILILLGIFLGECQKEKRRLLFGSLGCISILLFGTLFMQTSITGQYERYLRANKTNQQYQDLKSYVKEHENNYYFWDVYSFTKYSEKMFVNVDNSLANIDIMGGWLYKSPLTTEKLAVFGFNSSEKAILNGENVYIVEANMERTDTPCFTDWVTAYYAYRGVEVSVEQTDSVYTDGEEIFRIYQVQPES